MISHRANQQPKPFVHKKTGNIYVVLGSGLDCTNNRDGTQVVIYQREDNPGLLFVREEKEFMEKFESL